MHEYSMKSRCIPINVNITSATRHQQRSSMRNTKITGRDVAALITRSVIGAAWHLPERNPRTGVAMHRELFVNGYCSFFIRSLGYIFIVRRLTSSNQS
jgi:hypothetical protein